MFDELLRQPGVVEEWELRSPFGFLAIHGGSLELAAAEVAAEAADRAGMSFYAVRQPENLRWHIPSALVDPSTSPALRALLDRVDVVRVQRCVLDSRSFTLPPVHHSRDGRAVRPPRTRRIAPRRLLQCSQDARKSSGSYHGPPSSTGMMWST